MKCTTCGEEFDRPEAGLCPICGAPAGGPGRAGGASGPAWEKRSSLLDVEAIYDTIKGCLVEPTRTFATMRRQGDLGSPLMFGVGLGSLGAIAGMLWQAALKTSVLSHVPAEFQQNMGALPVFFAAGFSLFALVFAPVAIIVAVFLISGILHLALMILGAAKNGFEATFRVVAYSQGSIAPFQLIPVCGGVVGGIWGFVIMVIGLKEIQGTSTGKAVVAVLAPLLLCCACAFGAAMLFGFGMAGLHGVQGAR